MGAETEGQADAIRHLKVMVGMHIEVMKAAEKGMRRMYWLDVGYMWAMRALVLLNVAIFAWDMVDFPHGWAWCFAPIAAWGAWSPFKTSESIACDVRKMRASLRDVREKIKQAERMAVNEG